MDTLIVQIDLLDAHIQSLAKLSETLYSAMQSVRQAVSLLNSSDSQTISRLRADLLQKQKRINQIDSELVRLRRALIECRDRFVETEQQLTRMTFQPPQSNPGSGSAGAAGSHHGPHHPAPPPFVTPRQPKHRGQNKRFAPMPPHINGGRRHTTSKPKTSSWRFSSDMIAVVAEAAVIFNMIRIFAPVWLDQYLG